MAKQENTVVNSASTRAMPLKRAGGHQFAARSPARPMQHHGHSIAADPVISPSG